MLPLADQPVFDADGIRLYAGRCESVVPLLPDLFDAVLIDPPYQTTKNTWDRMIDPKILWHVLAGVSRPRTPVLMFGSGLFVAEMMISNKKQYRYDLIWRKAERDEKTGEMRGQITGHLNAKHQPLREHENVMVFYRQKPYYDPQMVYTGRRSHSRGRSGAEKADRTVNHYNRFTDTPTVDQGGYQYPRSILEFRRPKPAKHPTQKPIRLMEWLIRSYTRPGALILDCTAGSSTTLVAARNCGRRAVGVEADLKHVATSVERLRSGAEGDRWW